MTSVFREIIEKQQKQRRFYTPGIAPPNGGICIVIRDGIIAQVVDGGGRIHETRKKQYTMLIQNMLRWYRVKDCNVNISLNDHPMPGVFNFCREKGASKCFLLPNHRFTSDDVHIGVDDSFKNFDEQRNHIRSIIPRQKVPKIYTSMIPHRSKIPFLRYTLQNTDICEAYAYIGGPHKQADLDDGLLDKLIGAGFAGGFIRVWSEHLKYKYLLYNDGNTLSDRMRLLLCSDSLIIKKASVYEEFYSYRLRDGGNYIEYRDEGELRGIVERFENDRLAYDMIISNNRWFVDMELNYEQILLYCAEVIDAVC